MGICKGEYIMKIGVLGFGLFKEIRAENAENVVSGGSDWIKLKDGTQIIGVSQFRGTRFDQVIAFEDTEVDCILSGEVPEEWGIIRVTKF